MNRYQSFLSAIRSKFSDIIAEADENKCKWFELFIDEGDELGTHTIDRGNTFDEAVLYYEKHIEDYGVDKIFLEIWSHKEEDEWIFPDNIFSFWDANDISNHFNKDNKNESIYQ